MHIVGIAGSLRSGSYNAALLRAARELQPESIRIADIAAVPLYNADLEHSAFPEAVIALQAQLRAADGLLLVSPEYNNSVPGVLKNAVDWLSRPSPKYRDVFAGKPVGLLGASTGGFGTTLAQTAWLPVLRTLRGRLWTDKRLLLSHAAALFDDRGQLTDGEARKRLAGYLDGFLGYCAEVKRQAAQTGT